MKVVDQYRLFPIARAAESASQQLFSAFLKGSAAPLRPCAPSFGVALVTVTAGWFDASGADCANHPRGGWLMQRLSQRFEENQNEYAADVRGQSTSNRRTLQNRNLGSIFNRSLGTGIFVVALSTSAPLGATPVTYYLTGGGEPSGYQVSLYVDGTRVYVTPQSPLIRWQHLQENVVASFDNTNNTMQILSMNGQGAAPTSGLIPNAGPLGANVPYNVNASLSWATTGAGAVVSPNPITRHFTIPLMTGTMLLSGAATVSGITQNFSMATSFHMTRGNFDDQRYSYNSLLNQLTVEIGWIDGGFGHDSTIRVKPDIGGQNPVGSSVFRNEFEVFSGDLGSHRVSLSLKLCMNICGTNTNEAPEMIAYEFGYTGVGVPEPNIAAAGLLMTLVIGWASRRAIWKST